ncbi:MAG: hypothetical protein EOO53_18550 [Gammaproteobacteria bacterium]|nr:MAG: hypothetical protein EOO53_18550 [Gammaproteobacteria bacterium]
MKFKRLTLIAALILSTTVVAAEGKKITKADAGDYVDCAAFYASVITSLTTQGTLDEARQISLSERGNFYLETAKIYDGVTELSLDMKSRFSTSNKEYVASAYSMLKDPDKDVYSNYVDARISECKAMLDINSKVLLQKQALKNK